MIYFNDFRFDLVSSELRSSDNQSHPLRAQSAEVLTVLAKRPNAVVTKEELFDAVWPDVSVTDDSVTQCIADIRKAIGDNDRTILRTVPKKGYQLVASHTPPQTRVDAVRPKRSGMRRGAMVGFIVMSLVVVVLAIWRSQPTEVVKQANMPEASITVLPFIDLSPDRNLSHFADGMAEDLITDLARWKEFKVTARKSAMIYKDRPIDVREVAREMNTRYVLEGSVRRIGDEMRITAQLIDGQTGNHVWAERFEDTNSKILALQDSVIGRIVQTLIGSHGVIREDEYAKTWAKAEAELDEYDYYLRGHALFYKFTAEDTVKAIEIWKEGLEKFPDSGLLKIKLAWGYESERLWKFTDTPQSLETIHGLVLQGMSDPKLPPAGHRYGLRLLASVQVDIGNRSAALKTVKDVVRSYPFDSEGLFFMASIVTSTGDYVFADTLYSRGLELGYKADAWDNIDLGSLRYAQDNCARAIPVLEEALVIDRSTLLLAGCYADGGRIDDARDLLAKASQEFAITSPADFPAKLRGMPGVAERLTAQLAKADWPK